MKNMEINKKSESEKLAAVKKDPWLMTSIKNPSEKVQLAAVRKDGSLITYIEKPSEKVKLAAVKNFGDILQCISDPSEEIQLAAVKEYGYAIRFIENPSEEVQLAAVEKDGEVIQYIKNPSDKVVFKAIRGSFNRQKKDLKKMLLDFPISEEEINKIYRYTLYNVVNLSKTNHLKDSKILEYVISEVPDSGLANFLLTKYDDPDKVYKGLPDALKLLIEIKQ